MAKRNPWKKWENFEKKGYDNEKILEAILKKEKSLQKLYALALTVAQVQREVKEDITIHPLGVCMLLSPPRCSLCPFLGEYKNCKFVDVDFDNIAVAKKAYKMAFGYRTFRKLTVAKNAK